MIVYTIITSVTFVSQMDDIRAVVSEFVIDMAEVPLTEGDTAQRALFQELLAKYTTEHGVKYDDSYDRQELYDNFLGFLMQKDACVKVHSVQVRFDEDLSEDISCFRAGVRYAQANCNVRISYEMDIPQRYVNESGDPALFVHLPGVYPEENYLLEKGEEGEADSIYRYTVNISYNVTMIMEKTMGSWRINSIQDTYLWGDIYENKEVGK